MTDPKIVDITLAGHSYPVVIGPALLENAAYWISPLLPRQHSVIITDETVAALHLPKLQQNLESNGIKLDVLVLPTGEKTKNWQTLERILAFLVDAKIERTDAIVALGGGVIGDITGFAASILRRGCNFIQLPTTLLAQVDSSVGGKTAINMPQGKNLVGAFHQPVLVLADTDVLATLPRRELLAGYAEVVKYGLINDAAFFDWCDTHAEALVAGDTSARAHAIETSVRAKGFIVAQDPHETNGTRALLNLGHTFGHALEAETGYSNALLHGEGVAAGIVLAFQFSTARGICSAADAARVTAHFNRLAMKTSIAAITTASGAKLVAHMLQDKKRQQGTLPFLLARGIGQTYLDASVNLADVAAFLDGTFSPLTLAAE
jgi:3-dehydroquinate synthase